MISLQKAITTHHQFGDGRTCAMCGHVKTVHSFNLMLCCDSYDNNNLLHYVQAHLTSKQLLPLKCLCVTLWCIRLFTVYCALRLLAVNCHFHDFHIFFGLFSSLTLVWKWFFSDYIMQLNIKFPSDSEHRNCAWMMWKNQNNIDSFYKTTLLIGFAVGNDELIQ